MNAVITSVSQAGRTNSGCLLMEMTPTGWDAKKGGNVIFGWDSRQ